jgi:hypothetical protein
LCPEKSALGGRRLHEAGSGHWAYALTSNLTV